MCETSIFIFFPQNFISLHHLLLPISGFLEMDGSVQKPFPYSSYLACLNPVSEEPISPVRRSRSFTWLWATITQQTISVFFFFFFYRRQPFRRSLEVARGTCSGEKPWRRRSWHVRITLLCLNPSVATSWQGDPRLVNQPPWAMISARTARKQICFASELWWRLTEG